MSRSSNLKRDALAAMSSSGQAAGVAAQLTTRSSPHPRELALPIRASAPPPLHELDEDTFELCFGVHFGRR